MTNEKTDKDKWIGQERLRWARAFDVPMIDTVPANFPPNTLHTMRAVCALSRLSPDDDKQDKLVRGLEALFGAMWTEHAEVARPDVFGPVLVKALGEEVAEKGEYFSSSSYHFHLFILVGAASSLLVRHVPPP